MDVIDASYMEVIRRYLDEHVDYTWKATKHDGAWHTAITDKDDVHLYYTQGVSFGEAVKKLALRLQWK